ncbi:MIF-like protein mif-3 [Caenorhabditis elegans]|uniref:MIF-like protein mif-3 n=1 Tax=Caenorhabditis elegans TaxID=6239 RepID=MIF3_CAEEL|nr:MIF-like protein mif-3 [Caenorhabditis elegans]P90835.1 RecName: Full=MIF-like protein mif-3 [Caenorhabditis elegans]CAA95795.1 MIF-like protein mif-3 [Caenorhabditis elegans]|eukprot:NP_492069.1 MIF-like protein mif-3 [Caenorhabditis elegans]
MPVIKVQTNVKKVSDGFEVRLAIHMAKVMKRPESQIFVSLDMNSRMTRGQLTDPLAVLDVTSSTVLTPILTEEYTVALCEFFSQELALDSDAVLINYRSLSPELIGFNGHILTENRPFISTDRARFIIGVLGIAFLAFLLQFLKYI